jgi:putative endonuclease
LGWSVYIVTCNDGTLYTGITTDVNRRIEQHNAGKGAKYTRFRRPVKLLACREVYTVSNALKIEAAVKRQHKSKKENYLLTYELM